MLPGGSKPCSDSRSRTRAGWGADGFAFVLQNDGPDAMAGRGSAGGFALGDGWRDPTMPGIPRSIAVFFDTYRNDDSNDPSDNYVAICTNGPIAKMRWPPNRLGVGTKIKIWLKDGRVHLARVRYKPPWMLVSLNDGEPVVRAPIDVRTVIDASGFAYVGFTASTGNGYENHDILAWGFTPAEARVTSDVTVVQSTITFIRTDCLEGRNLCTPSSAQVEQTGPDQYHIILPANLPWGASIPNPEGRGVTVANAQGNVCWDLAVQEGCNGPEGAAGANLEERALASLLSADSNPGALIVRTDEGKTSFSVNGRTGRSFSSNQGFFEFDVTLK